MRSVLSFSPNMPGRGRLKCLQGTPLSQRQKQTLFSKQTKLATPCAALLERGPQHSAGLPWSPGLAAQGTVNKPAGMDPSCAHYFTSQAPPNLPSEDPGSLTLDASMHRQPKDLPERAAAQPDLVPDSTGPKSAVSRSHKPQNNSLPRETVSETVFPTRQSSRLQRDTPQL